MKIVADSCCDITTQEEKELEINIVPLTLFLGEESFLDDSQLNLEDYKHKLSLYKGRATSACPSPGSFKEAFMEEDETFCITLSNNLSGTYNSAELGKEMAEEEGKRVEIIDSKSASAAEALIAYEIHDLIEQGLKFDEITERILEFVKKMKTYFVLENMDNLVKNGRLNKITGKIITALHVKPIMGADDEGNIKLYNYARTKKQILEKLVGMVKDVKNAEETFRLVIAHNNNTPLAENLKADLLNVFSAINIRIVPTRGLSSMYADEKGIIIAF
jgi:DegV family protein with EDD domain